MAEAPDLPRSKRQDIVRAVVEPYLTAKKDRTMRSQYERIEPGPDLKIRTNMSPLITETSRLASSEVFYEPSTNLQNLSKKESYKDDLYRVRDCFVAPEDMVFLAIDYEKAEAVIVAAESEDWAFYNKLTSEAFDVHDWHAEQVWGPDFTKLQRQIGKRVTYASFYKAKVRTITRKINADVEGFRVTEAQVRKVHDLLLDLHPLESWWDEVWERLMDPSRDGGERWLENSLGFRRKFYNPNDDKCWKEAVNFFAQSGVAQVINRALLDFWNELDEPGVCEFVLQVHDELLFQVREDAVEDYTDKIASIMTRPFEVKGREIHIPIEADVGKRWGGRREHDDEDIGRLRSLGAWMKRDHD